MKLVYAVQNVMTEDIIPEAGIGVDGDDVFRHYVLNCVYEFHPFLQIVGAPAAVSKNPVHTPPANAAATVGVASP
jgi:hypothetical protein